MFESTFSFPLGEDIAALRDAVRDFAQNEIAPRAAEIGWSAMSLFGCCSVRPLDHFGSAGLLWNVAGGKLIRLHKDWAVIAGADGAERVFHRRPTAANGTLPWRLR